MARRPLVALTAAVLAGCVVQSAPPRPHPPPRPRTRAAARTEPGPAAAPAPQVRPDDAPPPDPAAARTLAGSRQAAASLAPGRPSRVTETGLENTARGEAPGATARGDLLVATIAEGQRAAVPIDIGTDECVTFVAHGGLGVVEVDLFVTTGEGADVAIVSQDRQAGPIAVIGGRGGCLRVDKPLRGELQVQVRRGAGPVAVRAFRR